VTERWRDRWLNVHPALPPSFPECTVRDALAYRQGDRRPGTSSTTASTGPDRAAGDRRVRDEYDWDSLEPRIHEVEHRLLPAPFRPCWKTGWWWRVGTYAS
jgi:folate-dependent phosphoribosylglycinamide formyltransferase PurN